DRDVAVQRAGDPPAHGEADAGAAARAGLQAGELLEHELLLLLGDAGPGVGDVDGDPPARPRRRAALALLDAHRDPARLRVLHRVREQVAEHLTDACGVALDDGQFVRQLRVQRETLPFCLRAVLLHDGTGRVAHVGRRLLDLDLTGLPTREREQIL